MTTTLKRLPKKITNEIRYILEGCRDGKLKHEQSEVHCGSSHCICGWKAVLDTAKATKNDHLTECDFDEEPECENQINTFLFEEAGDLTEWIYTRRQWRLTGKEAHYFFNADAAFSTQFALLEKLEAGERVK